jgi:peptide/nickel transport system substrate-binding protein
MEATSNDTYNPERAKNLIAQTGYTSEELKIPMYTTSDYADLLEYIQHALNKVGIQASVQVMQSANFKEQTSQAKLPVFRKSWLADYPDAENFLGVFKSNRFAPSGPNYTHFQSGEFDAMYDLASSETNDSLRLQVYRKMNELLMRERPVIPLFYDQVSHFVAAYVKGFQTNAINMLDLTYVSKR